MSVLGARVMPLVQQLRGAKRRYSSRRLTRLRIARQVKNPASFVPPKLPGVIVERSDVAGWPVFTVSRVEGTAATAVYFHGGSYVFEINPRHWKLIADLVRTTGATITVPIYPLAPHGTAAAVVPVATDLAAAIPDAVIMGDSAGGGLALAVAIALRDRGIRRRTALISPWLDATLSDPSIPKLEEDDPWLARPGMAFAADLWRGDLPLGDPRVSPLLDDITGIGPITLFVGTRDLLSADARALVRRARVSGVEVDFHEAPGMVHVYPILPIPEAEAAKVVLRALLTAGGRA